MMKKTLILGFLFSSAALSQAAVILTFGSTQQDFATDSFNLNGQGNGAGGGEWTSDTLALSDGSSATFSITDGKIWDYSLSETVKQSSWGNTDALEQLNNALGTSLTATQLCDLSYEASGSYGSHSSVTLDFTGNPNVVAGSSITLYAVVVASADNSSASYTNFSATGFSSYSWKWASASSGDGFTEGNINVANGNYALIEITGVLGDSQQVTLESTTAKNGWAMVAYNIPAASVPEPATATLGALALMGLSMRRRRK